MIEINGEKIRVIDAHCHIYPEKIAEKAVAGTDRFYNIKSLYSGTVEGLLSQGDSNGVDHYIVQSVATTPKQVRSINEFIAAEVQNAGGRLTGLGTLHPDSTDQRGDVEHLIELGLRGVKLHPDIQQFKIDDYRCLKIYELCEEKHLPILMHTGDSRYDYSNPNRLIPVLNIYTGLTIIGAHFGGWSIWEEAVEKLHGLPNLYVDSSSSFGFMKDPSIGRKLISGYGADRVLFGTDYPMWGTEYDMGLIKGFGFTADEYRMIFSGNAEKIFGRLG